MRRLTLLLICLLLLPLRLEARLDPALAWQVVATEHFRIVFHTGYDDWASRTAQLAEEIHQRLTPELLHEPSEPTTVILADVSDLTNGMATPYPANRIFLYLAPPREEPFELTDRVEWLRLVLTHEYAHILHLDNVEQGPKGLQRVIGRLYFPNIFQPSWLIEGLATWEETRHTTGGRGRSTYAEMLLRCAALNNDFPTLAQAAVAPERWPGGAIPYIFGAAFYRHLIEKYGAATPGRISEAYAGRSLPFLVDSTARMVIGTTYQREWSDWLAELGLKYGAERGTITAAGLTPFTLETTDGGENLGPTPSPDGRYLAWSRRSADLTPQLVVRDRLTDRIVVSQRRLNPTDGAGMAWSPDSRRLIVAQIEQDGRDNLFGDLFRLEIATGEVTRLTTGLRAAMPDVNPGDGSIVCVRLHRGETSLTILDADGKGGRTLVDGVDGRIFSSPRWSPDGTQLAVGVQGRDGSFSIELLDRAGRSVQRLPATNAIATSPAWTPDGAFILFTSDRSGIFNLHAWRPADNALFQITNLLGGAFNPAVGSDNRLLFTSYSARGFDLASLPLAPQGWQPIAASTDDRPPPPVERAAPPVPSTPYAVRWHELAPRYWLPWITSDEAGTQLGLTTSGGDPLDRHIYALSALYGLSSRRPAWSLLYQYDGLYPTLTTTVADEAISYADLIAPGVDYWERRRHLDIDADFPSSGLWSRWHLIPGVRLVDFTPLDPPGSGGTLTGARLAWRFANTVKPRRAISLEDGRQVEIAGEEYAKGVGDYRLSRQSLDWREYTVLPHAGHHVAATRLFAGRSSGDRLPQGVWQAGGDTPGDLPTTGLDTLSLPLRGYRTNTYRGENVVLASLEYRFPLLEVDNGNENGLFYVRRLHGALFAEGADLFDSGGPRLGRAHPAAGGEVRLDLDLGYLLPLTMRLIVARGFDPEGEDQVYLSAWARF